MFERQQKLLQHLHVQAHIARAMGICTPSFYAKLNALEAGKNPKIGLKTDNPRSFATAYKEAQIEFWSDLAAIAKEKLEELKNDN